MDRFDSMRLFTRVVERRSFTAAAADLGLPRSSATAAIKQLEERLGVQLLRRTTRHVTTTLDGEAYYQRCIGILADIEDAEGGFGAHEVRGRLSVDVNGHMARTFLLPELPALLARYPGLTVHIGEGDRLVDLVREGVDCVIRAGTLPDSDMIVRRLGIAREITVASPAYLERHGVPRTPDDLAGHMMIGFVSSRTRQVMPLEFTVDGMVREIVLPSRVTVANSDTSAALVRLGFGLFQAPRLRYADDLEAGRLVEVLPDFPPTPTPISVLYPPSRQLSPRVRVFVDWLVEILGPKLDAG
ncbi:LysR family transcriptional regulator [Mesorhizobium sp. M1A.F.Ca.IN.022.07.1.1]|uniref:LysR family transcriptional regulator n=4 Tax=Mesorhizobium TaxID=68287 RepID=UPI0007FE19E2|nr:MULTISPECIES: LysR family transcriptional regulator [unclassified Mesorhizobium]TGV92290.1 LysR family transcriptional regulator [Mesorhizobium sp. M00.F.Ca.ET.158.01.1.1]AZO58285.1 LysR family transcriptional regulator [Mesorhizobium sp. M1A.F.Ca.IN.022.06.1.1]MCT2579635.1 LysR family transcriptional regulator [Mesorhizobium sp. P13.3]MDF3168189.1 LysR family transcriptional regulator [Mesorhizobium sp. P16.1]MDF3177788.1 LysR family transcriptional regulator [Mesorhizobium sp. P17.1]